MSEELLKRITGGVRKAHFFRGGMDSTIINYNNVYINS